MKNKIKVRLPDGEIIERVPKTFMAGNFCVMEVRYKGLDYAVGDGDEYLRGAPAVFEFNSTGVRTWQGLFGGTDEK